MVPGIRRFLSYSSAVCMMISTGFLNEAIARSISTINCRRRPEKDVITRRSMSLWRSAFPVAQEPKRIIFWGENRCTRWLLISFISFLSNGLVFPLCRCLLPVLSVSMCHLHYYLIILTHPKSIVKSCPGKREKEKRLYFTSALSFIFFCILSKH
jgi:hypothetical protein